MCWYTCRKENGDVFPMWSENDFDTIEIPRQDVNFRFSLDKTSWIITKTYPKIEKDCIEMITENWCTLDGLVKMTCNPDVDRQMAKRKQLEGTKITFNDQEYELSVKHENYSGTWFHAKNEKNEYLQVMVNDSGMFIGVDGEWRLIKNDR